MLDADVDVFVGNNILIDPELYTLWIGGYTANEAASILQKRGLLQQYGATFDMLVSDTLDNYRIFAMLEKLLHSPTRLSEQLTFQIAADTQKFIVEKYYEFDAAIIREILGKKLSTKNRNNLDDVSEKTQIPLRSCRRQFDNVKRVFRVVEEMTGLLVQNIKQHFLLPNHLAEQYAAIVFVANNRFETTKKKLAYLTFDDFVFCANQMITNWSYSSKDCHAHEDMDQDLDRDFLHDLRDVKSLLERDVLDEHKVLVLKPLRKQTLTKHAINDLDANFKNISKIIINIGYSLNHSKELRDIFLDLVEKIIEPCRQNCWTFKDLQSFLTVYISSSRQLEPIYRNKKTNKAWDRYITTIASCLLQMYHN